MASSIANYGVQTVVDIYPYEGGTYTLTSNNGYLRGVTTTKSIAGTAGSFGITLSPGGPTGTSGLTWTQIITPMSFVVIAFLRGPYKQIVMLGVVTDITESQQWGQGDTQRVISINGMDLAYFFAQTNYYNLTFLYGDALAGTGSEVNMLGASNFGLITGTPAQLGTKWYNDIMAGNQGILSTTTFELNGNSYPFKSVFGTLFEEMDTDILIPTGANFLADQGNWLGKFQSFFQYPWYEFFINTAPLDYYGEDGNVADNPITSSSTQFAAAEAVVVARINPLPKLVNNGTPATPNWSVDLTKWNALNSFTTDRAGFLSSQVTLSSGDVRNFYLINPVSIVQMYGGQNGSINPFIMTQILFKDQDSINRYGYSPQTIETQWFFDYAGISARQNNQANSQNAIQNLCSDLLARAVGILHPIVLMASASVTLPLRPDIMIGNVFSYTPMKDGVLWDFYIEAVTHSFPFGGQPTTTLVLSRGLPHTTYTNPELLTAVFTGRAYRQNGTLSINSNAKGLTAVTLANAGSQETGYSVPQGGQQPAS